MGLKHHPQQHFAGGGEVGAGDDEVGDAGLGIEVVVDHDAGRGVLADDVAEGPHALELAVVTHDDEVGSFHDGAHLLFVTFINKDFIRARNPLEEVGEDVRCHDMDVGFGVVAMEP